MSKVQLRTQLQIELRHLIALHRQRKNDFGVLDHVVTHLNGIIDNRRVRLAAYGA